MIKFVDPSITPLTEADIVGKFVAKDGILKWQAYSLPALVSSVKSNRVYRDIPETQKNDDGSHSLLPKEMWTRSDYINLASVRVVCDTPEDVEALMRANLQAIRTHRKLQSEMDAAISLIFEDAAIAS